MTLVSKNRLLCSAHRTAMPQGLLISVQFSNLQAVPSDELVLIMVGEIFGTQFKIHKIHSKMPKVSQFHK